MRIGGWDIAEGVLVVAELGNNHEGDLGRARDLVEAAAEAGAGAVKLQTFRAERLVRPSETARLEQLRSFELPREAFAELAELARGLGLRFISTPFDLESAELLDGTVDAFKIASGDNDFYPLLQRVAATGAPLIVSTGLSDLEQVERTVSAVEGSHPAGNRDLALLHCVSAYPAQPGELNLRAIPLLAERFGYPVGYSDHALGIDAALAAVALGARIVEKHFTLESLASRSDFRDHALSATPGEMRKLTAALDDAAGVGADEILDGAGEMLGEPEKSVQPGEQPALVSARRSIAAARSLPAGHVLTEADLTWLRPAGGLPPGQEDRLIGGALTRDVDAYETLHPEDVES